jgi:hypothetical protein
MSNEHTLVYTAVYGSKDDALADLDAVEDLHADGVIGDYDAAVVDKENGQPHIVKRVDDPSYDVVSQLFDGAVPTDDELNKAAAGLFEGEAGLIVVAESMLEEELDRATEHAVTTAKQELNTQISKLQASSKS